MGVCVCKGEECVRACVCVCECICKCGCVRYVSEREEESESESEKCVCVHAVVGTLKFHLLECTISNIL